MNINLAPGMNEIIIREGAAPKVLDPKAPVKMNINGTIGAPVEFLKKRINAGQFEQKNCHIIVDRENITIELVVNESDEYTRGTIKGILQFHPKFIEFGINTGKVWSPFEFSMFCKMNRAFFADKNANMTLVSACKNFTATVNNAIERSIKATERTISPKWSIPTCRNRSRFQSLFSRAATRRTWRWKHSPRLTDATLHSC